MLYTHHVVVVVVVVVVRCLWSLDDRDLWFFEVIVVGGELWFCFIVVFTEDAIARCCILCFAYFQCFV